MALLSPFAFRWDAGFLATRLAGFLRMDPTPGDVVDAVRNLVLFAGWGVLWIATSDADDSRPRRLLHATATGLALSLAAEAVQLALPIRAPTALDVISNTAGAAGGAWIGLAAVRWLTDRRGRPTLLGVPLPAVALPYLAAAAMEAAFPLMRHATPPGSYGGPLTRAAWSFEQLSLESLAVLPLTDALLFLPAGILCASALREAGSGRGASVAGTAGVGLALALLGELAHAPLGQAMELGPVLVHAAAVAAGGWAGAYLLPAGRVGRQGAAAWRESGQRGVAGARSGRREPGGPGTVLFLVGYVLLLLLWNLRPFVPRSDPGAILGHLVWSRWIPLEALGGRADLYSVSDILRNFLLLLPVGAVLAVRPLRAGGMLAGTLPALLLAAVLELGQAFVAGRFFDVTDLLISFAGAWIAWHLVREAGFRRGRPLTGRRGVRGGDG